MSSERWDELLREVTAVPGVRGALVMSADDGLVIAESAIEGVETSDVAALAAALAARATRTAAALREPRVGMVQLTAASGVLLAAAGPSPLWLVALAAPDAELGRLRLLLGDFASALA